jgi:hypothetical protein
MSARTSDFEILRWKESSREDYLSFPIKASETVYKGCLAGIDENGYLVNLTSTNIHDVSMIVIPVEGYIETDAVNGSISGSQEIGVNMVKCRINATPRWEALSGASQALVGRDVFATNNNDVNFTGIGVKIGKFVQYLGSATIGYIEIESHVPKTGVMKFALTAATDGTAAAVLSHQNNTGKTILVKDVRVIVDTAPTDALGGIDVGIASTAASSDTLLDGLVLIAGLLAVANDVGANGVVPRLWLNNYYLTATSTTGSHLDLSGLVANIFIDYEILN